MGFHASWMINTLQIPCLKRWLHHSPKPEFVLHLTEVRRKSACEQGVWTGGIVGHTRYYNHWHLYISKHMHPFSCTNLTTISPCSLNVSAWVPCLVSLMQIIFPLISIHMDLSESLARLGPAKYAPTIAGSLIQEYIQIDSKEKEQRS